MYKTPRVFLFPKTQTKLLLLKARYSLTVLKVPLNSNQSINLGPLIVIFSFTEKGVWWWRWHHTWRNSQQLRQRDCWQSKGVFCTFMYLWNVLTLIFYSLTFLMCMLCVLLFILWLSCDVINDTNNKDDGNAGVVDTSAASTVVADRGQHSALQRWATGVRDAT